MGDDVDKLLFGDPDPPPVPPQPVGGAMQPPSAFAPMEMSDFDFATGLAGGGPQAQTPADEEAMMAHALRLSAEEPPASSQDDARFAEALRISNLQAQTGASAPEPVPPAPAPDSVAATPPLPSPDAADDEDEDATLAEALRLSIEAHQAHLSAAGDGAAAVQKETGGVGAEESEDKLPSGRRIKWAGETGTLEQLEAMGFDRDLATKALLETQVLSRSRTFGAPHSPILARKPLWFHRVSLLLPASSRASQASLSTIIRSPIQKKRSVSTRGNRLFLKLSRP